MPTVLPGSRWPAKSKKDLVGRVYRCLCGCRLRITKKDLPNISDRVTMDPVFILDHCPRCERGVVLE